MSTTKRVPKQIGPWRIGRSLGKGSSGHVKLVKHAQTGAYAAVKIVPQSILTSRMNMSEANAHKMMQSIEREIVIMKLIDHPNILSLYDVWETSQELYLVIEYVSGGELFEYLVKSGRLDRDESLHYFQQIIYAVSYCHSVNLCHRDLKLENILLDREKNIRVCDFGMSKLQIGANLLQTSCGSPHYAAPEIVSGIAYDGAASDIWSCGIILFALLTGRLPFDDPDIRSLLSKVKVGAFKMPEDLSPDERDLISRMLERDPEKRIKIGDILTHPYFTRMPPKLSASVPREQLNIQTAVKASDIYPDVLDNLKTLWSDVDETSLKQRLAAPETNDEKTIYHLLLRYRNKHLEALTQDEVQAEGESKEGAKSSADKENVKAPLPVAKDKSPNARPPIPSQANPPRIEPLVSKSVQTNSVAPAPVSKTGRDRNSANVDKIMFTADRPTIDRAWTNQNTTTTSRAESRSDAPKTARLTFDFEREARPNLDRAQSMQAPAKSAPKTTFAEPSTDAQYGRSLTTRHSTQSRNISAPASTSTPAPIYIPERGRERDRVRSLEPPPKNGGPPRIPVLQLQTATPERPERPTSLGIGDRLRDASHERSTSRPASISVPKVKDLAVQKFFEDIAEQIASMKGERSEPSSPGWISSAGEEDGRFEDADEAAAIYLDGPQAATALGVLPVGLGFSLDRPTLERRSSTRVREEEPKKPRKWWHWKWSK